MNSDRKSLPYRERVEGFLIHKGKIAGLDRKHYVLFPGGGVDTGETPERSLRREIKEEVGCEVVELKHIITVDADWWPEWTEGKPKREERYKEFRGERTHIFIGFIKEFGKPISDEGDAWPGGAKQNMIPIPKLIEILESQIDKTHSNFLCYTQLQIATIKTIKYFRDALK
jgi:8-oxo-dGTP pyrophosphatase MutT (NUDIX family)